MKRYVLYCFYILSLCGCSNDFSLVFTISPSIVNLDEVNCVVKSFHLKPEVEGSFYEVSPLNNGMFYVSSYLRKDEKRYDMIFSIFWRKSNMDKVFFNGEEKLYFREIIRTRVELLRTCEVEVPSVICSQSRNIAEQYDFCKFIIPK